MKFEQKDILFALTLIIVLVCAILLLTENSDRKVNATNTKKYFQEEGEKTYYTIYVKDIPLLVEIAASPEERRRGLMGRKKLDENTGMLFIFPQEDHRNFWMKNTYIPLSIAFIDKNGVITQIEYMYPERDESKSFDRVKYALEVNKDWFKKNKIKSGDVVRIPNKVKGIDVK